jgi:signal peptidase I
VRKLWREWVKPLLIILLVLCSVRSAVADWNDVPTGSMKPSILEGDRIFINKLAYDVRVPFLGWRLFKTSDPQRGEVVVFDSPADGTRLVKRVVGLPGDVIQVIDNRLWVNGRPADYQPLDRRIVNQIDATEQPQHRFAAERIDGPAHPVMVTPGAEGLSSYGPVTVPAGHYFMMGDNRDNSLDSRIFGFVRRDAILGHATAVVMSFHNGPRWGRFFHKMD